MQFVFAALLYNAEKEFTKRENKRQRIIRNTEALFLILHGPLMESYALGDKTATHAIDNRCQLLPSEVKAVNCLLINAVIVHRVLSLFVF